MKSTDRNSEATSQQAELRSRIAPARRIEPRGLRRPDAAAYVGVSTSHFDSWVRAEIMPQPRVVGGVVVWDRFELDAAFDQLPRREENSIWDAPN